MSIPDYRRLLSEVFEAKKKVNSRFSLRAYANFLGMDSSSLSSILKGKRPLPLSRLYDVVARLQLNPEQSNLFKVSLEAEHTRLQRLPSTIADRVRVGVESEAQIRMMLNWEHLAIYALLATVKEARKLAWICRRLNLEEDAALECLQDLIEQKMVVQEGDAFRKIGQWISMMKGNDFSTVIQSQKECINLLWEKESLMNANNCSLTSSTFSADPEKIEGAKKIIDDFRAKLSTYLRQSSNNTEVYQLNLHLFPLTEKDDGNVD